MYGDALVGLVLGGYGCFNDRTTAMLTDQIRKRVCLQIDWFSPFNSLSAY